MRWLLLVLLVPLVAAYDEDAAGDLHPDVEAAGHLPDEVRPGSQFEGYIVLREGHDIEQIKYQICRVGEACFAPPTDTTPDADGRTFRFDTQDYTVAGRPVDWGAGWRIGVQYLFFRAGNETPEYFPHGVDLTDPACKEDWIACSETHYLAFDTAAAKEAPAPSWLLLVLLLGLLAYRRSR